MEIEIASKDYKGVYECTSGKEAVKEFFADVLAGRIKRESLGLIGNWKEVGGEDEYPFRIASPLALVGWWTPQEIQAMIKAADPDLDFSIQQIKEMMAADSWMVDQWPDLIGEVQEG